jgi:excisionase family DNA binding protein
MNRQFLDIEKASEFLSISKSNLYKRVAAKEIPFHKVGKRTLFDVEEITLWVKSDGSLTQGKSPSFMDIKSFLD